MNVKIHSLIDLIHKACEPTEWFDGEIERPMHAGCYEVTVSRDWRGNKYPQPGPEFSSGCFSWYDNRWNRKADVPIADLRQPADRDLNFWWRGITQEALRRASWHIAPSRGLRWRIALKSGYGLKTWEVRWPGINEDLVPFAYLDSAVEWLLSKGVSKRDMQVALVDYVQRLQGLHQTGVAT